MSLTMLLWGPLALVMGFLLVIFILVMLCITGSKAAARWILGIRPTKHVDDKSSTQ